MLLKILPDIFCWTFAAVLAVFNGSVNIIAGFCGWEKGNFMIPVYHEWNIAEIKTQIIHKNAD